MGVCNYKLNMTLLTVLASILIFGSSANNSIYNNSLEPRVIEEDVIQSGSSDYEDVETDNANNPYMHMEWLDPKYHVSWVADDSVSKVTFNVTVRTTGYVGFGLSLKGRMDDADIVIGGVMGDGKPYFSDRHGNGHKIPEEDASQDWKLLEAKENGTHTFLSFSRAFDTCDKKDDLPLYLHGDLVSMIWAYGESDEDIGYHYQNRGSREVYLLDADLMPRMLRNAPPFGNFIDGMITPLGNWKVWTVATKQVVPAQDTSYLCTFHKAPVHNKKIHGVGFRIVTENEDDMQYIHHSGLHRCRPPPGIDGNEFFSDFVGIPGDFCYLLNAPIDRNRSPFQYCQEFVNVYAVGGKPNFLPEKVGIPISEDADEYWMWQLHYNNPSSQEGLEVNVAMEVFYTDKLREFDGGIMFVGTNFPGSPSILVPPSSINHVNYGICSAGCTELMLPESGINIFGAMLHTHTAGRGVRFHQIREGKHLPWILFDDNYNFNYQQHRIINPERKVLRGDTLMTRCIYDTTDRNGSTVIGGLSTRQEMCLTFAWYYPYIRHDAYGVCGSELRSNTYRDFVGIRNSTWSDRDRQSIVSDPIENEGFLHSEVVNSIEWTTEKRRRLQNYQRTLPQTSICPSLQVINPDVVHLSDPEFEFETIPPESVVLREKPSTCNVK